MPPFTVNPPVHAEEQTNGGIVADRRLYLAADEQTLVEHNDESAAFLFCAEGHTIGRKDVARLFLAVVDGRVEQRRPDASNAKAAEKPEDKKARNPATK